MKDIGNYKLLQVQDALQRLERAVGQLETAANALAPSVPLAREVPGLKARIEELGAQHAALRSTTVQVASRLDQAIARLSAVLETKPADNPEVQD